MNVVHTIVLKLIVISEIGFDDEYSIAPDKRIVIGRGETANIQISNDGLTSREHCGIYYTDSHFVIRDLGSSNGTQINQQDVDTAKINNDDVIGIGTTLFRAKIEANKSEVDIETTSENKKPSINDSASVNETTTALKINPNVEPKEPFSLFAEDQEEPSPNIDNTSSFKVQLILWQGQDGNSKISVIAKNTFKMLPGIEPKLADKPIPLFKQTYFYDDKDQGSVLYESDLVPFKPLADIVVVGKAHTPNKQSQQILDVGLQVGNVKKILKIFGDRHWHQAEEDGDFVISEPLPFTSMDIKYENSFGGYDLENEINCSQNIVGCGCIIEESLQNSELRKVPNIENPQDLYESWESRPDPVGLGFYASNWEPRIQYLGRYDPDEVKEGEPLGLPKNFSHHFYNSAHPDLQVEGYLEGDEKVELVNLSPKGRLILNLPNIKPEVVVSKKNQSKIDTEKTKCDKSHIKMNLDTLVFIPEEDVFYQVFRGVFTLDSMGDMHKLSIQVTDSEQL